MLVLYKNGVRELVVRYLVYPRDGCQPLPFHFSVNSTVTGGLITSLIVFYGMPAHAGSVGAILTGGKEADRLQTLCSRMYVKCCHESAVPLCKTSRI